MQGWDVALASAETPAPAAPAAPEVQPTSALGTEPAVSIIMPCLDEAATVGSCVDDVHKAFGPGGEPYEVVIGDNGSSDGSQDIARQHGARVAEVAERGYGSALLGAIAAARGELIVMADADRSYDFGDGPKVVAKLREGYDLVMGNRFAGGIRDGAMPWLNRYVGNPALSGIGRFLFRVPVNDFHCGLRGFRKSAIDQLHLQTTGMEFASEMVVKASLQGLRMAEVPTTLSPDGRGRPPHLRRWRDGWRHLRFMLLFSPRWLFLYPGLGLILLGLAVMALVVGGPRTIGGITFDVHTLLYSAVAVLLGFQAVLFSALTKAFALNEGFIPKDPRVTRWFRVVTLETGLIVGAALALLGIAASVRAIGVWGAEGFGRLDPVQMLRLVIPAALAIALGGQILLSSLFLSILGLRRRRL